MCEFSKIARGGPTRSDGVNSVKNKENQAEVIALASSLS